MKLLSYTPNPFDLRFSATRVGATLKLRYSWEGELSLPSSHEDLKERAHDLWRETCFEFFFCPINSTGEYFEINLSPHGMWNSYVFQSYRSTPLTQSDEVICQKFKLEENQLQAEFKLSARLSHLSFQSSPTVILADFKEREKFWALAHSQNGAPDFHDSATMIYYLAP